MTAWLCPEVLLVLSGVALILVDALAPHGLRKGVSFLALVLSISLLVWTLWSSSQPLPESWKNLFLVDGITVVFKPFFILCLVGVSLISM